MEQYEIMQTKEWIDKNFYRVKAKYNAINSAIILSGVSLSYYDEDNDYIVKHKRWIVVKDLLLVCYLPIWHVAIIRLLMGLTWNN